MAGRKKILHMDNERDTLSSVKTVLERAGCHVVDVLSGKEALKAINTEDFDLILLDIMMPDLSGWDIYTRIAKRDPDQKIAFLTVLEISSERKKTLEKLGIAEYFTKPIDINNFVKRIKAILKD